MESYAVIALLTIGLILQSYIVRKVSTKFKLNKFYTFYSILLIIAIACMLSIGLIFAHDILTGLVYGILSFLLIGIPYFIYEAKYNVANPVATLKIILEDLFIGAPLEELMFRGFLFTLILRQTNFAIALITSSAVFAVWHLRFDKRVLLQMFLSGLLFSTVFYISNSIVAPIICHALFNIGAGTLQPWLNKKFNA